MQVKSNVVLEFYDTGNDKTRFFRVSASNEFGKTMFWVDIPLSKFAEIIGTDVDTVEVEQYAFVYEPNIKAAVDNKPYMMSVKVDIGEIPPDGGKYIHKNRAHAIAWRHLRNTSQNETWKIGNPETDWYKLEYDNGNMWIYVPVYKKDK